MEEYFSEYGFTKNEILDYLNRYNSLIAGSFALACYLKNNQIDPGYKPNDIDIWVPSSVYSYSFERFFRDRAYIKSNKFERQNTYQSMQNHISSITPLIKNGKEIQIIYLKDNNVLEHIKNNFDITCCITWFNFNKEIETIDPESTLKKEMRLMLRNDKTCRRVVKYTNRGFVLKDNKIKDRFSKLLPVYDFYCNMKGYDPDKDKKYLRYKIIKTYNASILIKASYRYAQVNPNTICAQNKIYNDFYKMME